MRPARLLFPKCRLCHPIPGSSREPVRSSAKASYALHRSKGKMHPEFARWSGVLLCASLLLAGANAGDGRQDNQCAHCTRYGVAISGASFIGCCRSGTSFIACGRSLIFADFAVRLQLDHTPGDHYKCLLRNGLKRRPACSNEECALREIGGRSSIVLHGFLAVRWGRQLPNRCKASGAVMGTYVFAARP